MDSWRFTRGRIQNINKAKLSKELDISAADKLNLQISFSWKWQKKTSCCVEQLPDFLRIASRHIFLFGAEVYQTVVTPYSPFQWVWGDVRGLGGNSCSSIYNINQNVRNSIVRRRWETCNLRVTWPAGSHRRCPVEHAGLSKAERVQVYTQSFWVCLLVWEK